MKHRALRPAGKTAYASMWGLALFAGLAFSQWYAGAAADGTSASTAYVLTINGAIGPASSDYIVGGLERAASENARLIIIEIDTPGGLDSATREINKAILSSSVPVVAYVSPSGSRAASAGTYIMYAAHIAAMAPATNLGSATPVQITGDDIASDDKKKSGPAGAEDEDEKEAADNDDMKEGDGSSAMQRKVINDAVSYIRGLAEKRGRNADWAEAAVRDAVNLTSEDALEQNVIDVIATDIPDLLEQINGRTVSINNLDVQIDTTSLIVEHIERDWRNKLIDAITNPTVAFMLMMLGIYGLMFEGMNPGAIVPGVVGAIAILIALYAFQILSVNYAGLALIALGIILMIGEAVTPAFGVLGIGGVVAFVVGSVILMDSDVPGFSLDLGTIIPVAGAAALGMLGISWYTVRSRYRPNVAGTEIMINGHGHVREAFVDGRGTIWINGERWNAECSSDLNVGDEVRVVSMDGLTLNVEPAKHF